MAPSTYSRVSVMSNRAEPVMRSESSISASASSLIGRRPSAAGGGPAMRF